LPPDSEEVRPSGHVLTAGLGSDHFNLQAAMDRGITVAEVTYRISISVSEQAPSPTQPATPPATRKSRSLQEPLN